MQISILVVGKARTVILDFADLSETNLDLRDADNLACLTFYLKRSFQTLWQRGNIR